MEPDSCLNGRVKVIMRDNLDQGGIDGDEMKGCIRVFLHMNGPASNHLKCLH